MAMVSRQLERCYIPRPDKTRINFTLSYSDPDSEAMYYYTAYVLDLESRL